MDTKVYAMHGFGKPEVRFTGDNLETKRKNVEKRLQEFVDNHLQTSDEVEVEVLAEYGYPGDAVLEAAEKVDAHLIVVSMSGSTKPVERQIGSTAKEILRKVGTNRMVLAVPAGASFEGFNKLSFFTRFEFKDLRAMAVMLDLANLFGCQLEIFHVLQKGANPEEAELNMEILQRILRTMEFITFTIVEGDPKKLIRDHVLEEKVDLVGMLSHRQSFMEGLVEGSISKEMIGKLSIPMLAFRT